MDRTAFGLKTQLRSVGFSCGNSLSPDPRVLQGYLGSWQFLRRYAVPVSWIQDVRSPERKVADWRICLRFGWISWQPEGYRYS
jgi:hypothetical protein